jgi:hypothetical protein
MNAQTQTHTHSLTDTHTHTHSHTHTLTDTHRFRKILVHVRMKTLLVYFRRPHSARQEHHCALPEGDRCSRRVQYHQGQQCRHSPSPFLPRI